MPLWNDGEDIELGNGKVITWIDWDSDSVNIYDVDELLDPKNKFWLGLETVCVPECCGLHAFDWTTEGIKKAYAKCNSQGMQQTLDSAITALEKRTENVVCFTRINQLFERSVFINLLKHLKNCT